MAKKKAKRIAGPRKGWTWGPAKLTPTNDISLWKLPRTNWDKCRRVPCCRVVPVPTVSLS